jgi:hypothetical protein
MNGVDITEILLKVASNTITLILTLLINKLIWKKSTFSVFIAGKFTDVQRCLYEIVLRIQRQCIELCVPGHPYTLKLVI